MANLIHPAHILGSRYAITIAHVGDNCTATMRARGRKTTWTGFGTTPDAAKADVLRHLDKSIHPFVAVKIAP